MKIILASSSESRQKLIACAGYVPDMTIAPDIDETPLKGEKPRDISRRLAKLKAEKIAVEHPDKIVIASDTVTSVGRLSLPKTLMLEEAEFCMNKLSGKRHKVYTSVCVILGDRVVLKTDETVVKLKLLSEDEKRMFLESRQWYGKAGGFSIDGFAASFVQWISGAQESNVRGLPLYTLCKILNSMGAKRDESILNSDYIAENH